VQDGSLGPKIKEILKKQIYREYLGGGVGGNPARGKSQILEGDS
jgi:hypothetical protein